MVRVRSYERAGRLTASTARGVRARSVILTRGAIMDWHSTQDREELLILLTGRLRLDIQRPSSRLQSIRLSAGACAVLPQQTPHRVLNPTTVAAHYLYVTAPTGR